MHVKFCGFTQLSDIQTAAQLGADAVGLVFFIHQVHVQSR